MTEFEIIDAAQGFIGLTNELFFGYVSLMSGFLAMSYMVADRISSFLATIAVALFSIVSALLLFGIFLSRKNAEHLLVYLRTQTQSGEFELPWYGSNPTWSGDVMSLLYIFATFGGYLASLAYFFYSRRRPRSSS